MLGRLFGRTKDDRDDTVCSNCGRTLLAGEWTQRVVEDDGAERFICSLCARPEDAAGAPLQPAEEMATAAGGRVKPARADSDVFWRALKDKDAEIERLESLLARAEAEKQELAAQLAQSRGENRFERSPEIGADTTEMVAPAFEADEGASGAPAFEADEGAPADEPGGGGGAASVPDSDATHAAPLEHTDPRLGEALRRAAEPAESTAAADLPDAVLAPDVEDAPLAPALSPFDGGAGGAVPEPRLDHATAALAEPGEPPVPERAAMPVAVEPELDEFVPLTILQRGVDLLNVSAVPKRIVETNENLGIPQVHVGSQDENTLLITFMWTMGWYQFRVELADAGRITLADRGYEERIDLRPNASARTDGTVQLAPSQIKPPTPKDTSETKPTGVTSGVIISKSMMGQRTDDENVPADWKSKRAPDFDWGR
jgi:hypothetical protein